MEKGIAWIGFGEAAYHISKGLREKKFGRMTAYDPAKNDPVRGTIIKAHSIEVGIPLCDTPEQAIQEMDFIISLTSAKVAVNVAQEILPLMRPGQSFLDFNSASPDTKRKIADLERPDGVRVCDVAVMGPVPLNGSRVPLLITGEGKREFFQEMTQYGMRIECLDANVGGASAVKMIRSVFMKGFPQVMLECLLAAERYGVTEKMLDSLEETIGGKSVRQMADQLFIPTVIHASRRASEMKEVIQMLESIGMDPFMSEAAYRRLTKLASLHIVDEIGSNVKLDYQEVLSKILEYQSRTSEVSQEEK